MNSTNCGLRIADCGLARAGACEPFRPRKGFLAMSKTLLVAMSALTLAAALLAGTMARSREWPGLAAPSGRIAETELLHKAAGAGILARQAEDCLRRMKLAAGVARDPALGAADSAWIGAELTPLVTTLGSLEAKRASSSPDWARVLTIRLYHHGVRSGSVVAAGYSGSFPALNLALAAACQALGADLIAITSVTASTWGATQPGFTWPEIEVRLVQEGIIRRVSAAVTAGGQGDAALDLEPEARLLAWKILESCALALGAQIIAPSSLQDSIAERLRIYREHARDRRIVLYVNIGGTEASMGASAASFRIRSGFIPPEPFDLSPERGVIARLADRGVPTLSLLNIEDLAFRWGVLR
jgi:poly-gamma-glutamate system protein